MRIAHLADTHLGYRQYNLDEREQDFYDAFHEAVDKIIAEGCDAVVHAGDLFDEPRPHVRALVEVRKGLERLREAEIPFICIPGNHDILLRRGAIPPQRVYRHLKLLTPKNPWLEVDGVFIGGLPYHSKVHAHAMVEGLKELEKVADGYDKRILLLHQGVHELFSLESEIKLQEIPDTFDYYALGHIHNRIDWPYGRGTMSYPGSTEIWRLEEVGDYEENGKGFNIVDLDDNSVRRVDLDCIRPFIKINAGSELDIDAIKDALPSGRRAVLHLTVEMEPEEYKDAYGRLVKELDDGILHLEMKRAISGAKKEEGIPETVDIITLVSALMEERTQEERDLAMDLLKALSKADVETAKAKVDHFYQEVFD